MIFWDGNQFHLLSSPGRMFDIHFFEIGTGWGCGENKVYRYN